VHSRCAGRGFSAGSLELLFGCLIWARFQFSERPFDQRAIAFPGALLKATPQFFRSGRNSRLEGHV
jgi:hypothetical protein